MSAVELTFDDLDLLTRECPIHPSDITTFRRCPRKWAYRRIDGAVLEDPSFVADGNYGHALIESYYKYGDGLHEARVYLRKHHPQADHVRVETALLGVELPLAYNPQSPHNPEIERHFRLQHASGLWIEGTPDLVYSGLHDSAFICDWKFRDNIRPGTADQRVITTDPQAICYAWSVFECWPRVETIECCWYWINKPDKRTPSKPRRKPYTPTEVGFDRDSIVVAMAEHVIPTAIEMARMRLLHDYARDVPATPEIGCNYGKGYGVQNCSYSLYCPM